MYYVQLMKINVLIRFSNRRTEAQHFHACMSDEYYSSNSVKDYRLSVGEQNNKKKRGLLCWYMISYLFP